MNVMRIAILGVAAVAAGAAALLVRGVIGGGTPHRAPAPPPITVEVLVASGTLHRTCPGCGIGALGSVAEKRGVNTSSPASRPTSPRAVAASSCARPGHWPADRGCQYRGSRRAGLAATMTPGMRAIGVRDG